MAIDNTYGQQYSHYGRIYVTWTDLTNSIYYAIYFAYSDNGGRTWTRSILEDLGGYMPVSGNQTSPLTGDGPRDQSAIPALAKMGQCMLFI